MRYDKVVAGLIIGTRLLDALERREARQPHILRVLMYHRVAAVDSTGGMDPHLISATPKGFATQMRYLAESYNPITAEVAVAALANDGGLPPRSVLVTFDDAYRDFIEYAWPVLQQTGVPAILFAPTDFLSHGRPFWWDRLYGAFSHTCCELLTLEDGVSWPLADAAQRRRALSEVKAHLIGLEHRAAMRLVDRICARLGESPDDGHGLPQLTWEEVERLHADGLYVAPHTRNHPILSRVSQREARDEIVGSQADLASHLGYVSPLFAYPCGRQRDMCRELGPILREAGIRAAVTTVGGHNRLGRVDALRLRRMGVAPHVSLSQFRLALTMMYEAYAAIRKVGR
jgi:peptidoglycan/xylan/chitin deacetylase (PgdA/CDA1 family)